LDREALKQGLAARIEGAVKQKQPGAQVDIAPSDVKIRPIEPTSVSINDAEIPLYAVKAEVASPQSDGQPSTVMMVVDESAKLQLSVKKVSTGESLIQDAKDVVRQKDIDPELGDTVYSGDQGHDLVLVSDPFCGYCEKAVSYFLEHKSGISEWRMVHVPYMKKRGSDIAAWALMDGLDEVAADELLRFAYSDLEPAGRNATAKQKREKIVGQFMKRFPELKEKWGGVEQGFYYLKGKYKDRLQKQQEAAQGALEVRATPGVFIDGVPVKGWNPERYEELLSRN
jgi:hypothetical protein